jgi:hypothetical protein
MKRWKRTVVNELGFKVLNGLLEFTDAVSPDDETLLITDEAGVLRSTSKGESERKGREGQLRPSRRERKKEKGEQDVLRHSVNDLNVVLGGDAEVVGIGRDATDDDSDPVGGNGGGDLTVEGVERVVELAGGLALRVDDVVALGTTDRDGVEETVVLALLEPELGNEGAEGMASHEGVGGVGLGAKEEISIDY